MNPLESHNDDRLEAEDLMPAGYYVIELDFINRNGEKAKWVFSDIDIKDGETFEAVQKKVTSKAGAYGLHNTSIDTSSTKYPEGQPIIFRLKNQDSGEEFEFKRKISDNGSIKEI